MGKGGGLCPLEMGIARHHGIQIGLRLFNQYLLQVQDHADDHRDLLFYIEPEVHSHLVVPAAGGVESLARVADAGGELALNVHVDIFVLLGEFHCPGLNVLENRLETLDNLFRLMLLDDALFSQHGRMGDGARNVLLIEPGVKADGGIEIVDRRIGLLLESSCPKFHSNYHSK